MNILEQIQELTDSQLEKERDRISELIRTATNTRDLLEYEESRRKYSTKEET